MGEVENKEKNFKLTMKLPLLWCSPPMTTRSLVIVTLQPITGLCVRMRFMQAETAEASDWLQYHVTDERDVIRRSTGGGE